MFDKFKERLTATVIAVFILLLIAVLFLGSVYTVSEQEQAVIIRFGRAEGIQTAGLHFKLPFVERVERVSMVTRGMEIGYRTRDGAYENIEAESFMITKDFNFVMIDFYVEYKVSDPVKFLYRSVDAEGLLRNAIQAEARTIVSSYNVDEVLTVAKTEIQSRIKEELLNKLEQYQIGINVTNITIQDASPPTEQVTAAFKDVESAKQEKETAINTASREYNERIPSARASADAILKEAEGVKLARINEAKGQVARFENMFSEFIKNPSITRTRMYLETLESILPGVRVYIDYGNGALKLLNLE